MAIQYDAAATNGATPQTITAARQNLTVASTSVVTYLCPSMNLPRVVPDPSPACGEYGAAGSYAVSVGSQSGFAIYSASMPKPDGAIIPPQYGITTIPKIGGADGTSKTLLVGEINYGLTNYMWTECRPTDVKWGATALGGRLSRRHVGLHAGAAQQHLPAKPDRRTVLPTIRSVSLRPCRRGEFLFRRRQRRFHQRRNRCRHAQCTGYPSRGEIIDAGLY